VLYGCSTSNDSNGNSTTTIVPVSPTNLAGIVISTTQINLSWTDNSTNETGFKIERKTGSGTYAVVGTVNADVLTYNDLGLTPNTNYTYRVYSYNSGGNSQNYSNEITPSTNGISTSNITSITGCTAITGATISGYWDSTIIAKGVCWSTNSNPTILLTTKTTDGIGIASFTSNIIGLTANTTYFVRAYVSTNVGTDYGNEYSFTTQSLNVPGQNVIDIDGNIYNTSTNCGQTWMNSNLNVTHYRNGDVIPQITDPTAWATLTTGAWCYYANTSSNGTIYGKLYNWYAVNDTRGLAPAGYHIPSQLEWTNLLTCLGGGSVAGGAMKETGTTHWITNPGATNSSGFSGLPGGSRHNTSYGSINFNFAYINFNGFWWSSSVNGAAQPLGLTLYSDNSGTLIGYSSQNNGESVRCVKD
jgi:uncharacterized protein (TIGR02145 family)